MNAMLGRVTRGALAQVRHVSPPRPAAATGLVARVYEQVESDFGMLAPPIGLHAPAPEVLAAGWMMLRETLLCGSADRAAKEAVAAGVSLGNTCPYCVQVHGTFLHGLVRGRDAAAIASGRLESVTDPRVRQIAAWARASGTRAWARPFPGAGAPEFCGVAVAFQYLNRMVNVFLGDPPIPSGVPGSVRGGMMRLLGAVLRTATRRRVEAGSCLDLLPDAALPDDLCWAAAAPNVAGAFARATAAIEAAGRRSVPEPVRALVLAELAAWDGRPPGPRRSWVDEAVAGLAAGERAAGRLALLTAMASYQVVGEDVAGFRRERPDDGALVELTAWASLSAARRVGAWIA